MEIERSDFLPPVEGSLIYVFGVKFMAQLAGDSARPWEFDREVDVLQGVALLADSRRGLNAASVA